MSLLRYRVFYNSPRPLTWLAVAFDRSSPISSRISAIKRRWSFLGQVNWSQIIGWSVIHIGVVLAPLTFSWSGLVVCLVLYLLVGLGVTMGYHRLLTHRSFQTPRPVEYVLAVLGSLANQGGPLQWVAVHRIHHQHSDDEGDPHSPRDGIWWSHMLWWMLHVPAIHEPVVYQRYVPDLARDPVHRFLQRYHFLLSLGLGGSLFGLGHLWGGVGFSWVVWGMFVRTTVLYHATWLVNSATHLLGYRTYATRDSSTNLWWVALITLGEGWHNNHHAFPRSARHGIRWWELDVTFLFIRILGILRLARQIHVPGKILRPALASSSPNGEVADSESNHHG